MNLEEIKKQREATKAFFKEAFLVDGEVTIVGKKGFEIVSVIELNDSKRGRFYMARVEPKEKK